MHIKNEENKKNRDPVAEKCSCNMHNRCAYKAATVSDGKSKDSFKWVHFLKRVQYLGIITSFYFPTLLNGKI